YVVPPPLFSVLYLAHYRSRFSFFLSFFYCRAAHRALPSFPTRRSSDLSPRRPRPRSASRSATAGRRRPWRGGRAARRCGAPRRRSEEHTSELQSRFDLVCRLLLEKKKIRYPQKSTERKSKVK